ncbi:MAG: DNA polymerase III subunit epsilon [Alphaproteobacteria bacterium]
MSSKIREIVFDTETTGFHDRGGDRLIEIGCVELLNKKPTGKTFHKYCNPEGAIMSEGAYNVHKISLKFLSDKPLFKEIATDFLNFVGDSKLVAHNASFDMRFVNMELERAGLSPLLKEQSIDTLWIARKKVPELVNHKLDTLCDHFEVNRTEREEKGHGALLDSYILAEVYYALTTEREQKLFGDSKNTETRITTEKKFHPSRSFPVPTKEEIANHEKFIASIKNNKWEN